MTQLPQVDDLLGYSSFALAWGTLACGAARGVIAQILRPALPWPLRLDRVKPIVGTGSRLSLLYAIGAAGSRTPDLIVGKVLGLVAVGLYSRAASLSDQLRRLISGAIGSVFYPAFARIRDRGEPLGPPYLRVCAGYCVVIWPGMAGLALASTPLVRLLYGEAWMGVAPLLLMIALADAVLSISLLVVGCHWGVEGAAASRLVYGAAWIAIYARFLHGLVQFDAKALGRIYAKSALATCAAITPLALTYLFIASPAEIGLIALAAATGIGAMLWLGALAATRHPALDDLLGIVAHLPFVRNFRLITRFAR